MNHPRQELRAVIFDLDGTLIDTADDFVPAVQQLREEYGLPPMDAARIRASVSNGSRGLVSLALGLEEQHAGFAKARQRLLDLYEALLGRFAAPYTGIVDLLRTLEARQIRWGIATNKPRQYTIPLLKRLNLQCESVVCPDDVTQAKPHPESLFRGCRELGCAPTQGIYLGDHARDIEAGRRAGMYTIACAYGYIEPGDRPELWGANAIIDDPKTIEKHLLSEEA